jgi:type IV secretion system protein VirD4
VAEPAIGGNSGKGEVTMIWDGVPLGFDRNGRPISYNASADGSGNAPTLIFGPPGSFKTVGLICSELLDEPGKRSYVVLDPKGEICAITSKYRREVCGAENVKIINPYGLLVEERPDIKSDCWNPLNDLEPDALGFGDECQAKAAAVIKTESNESQKHFPDAARSAATLSTIWEVREADAQGLPRSLPNALRNTLCKPPDELRALIEKMVKSPDFDVSSRASKFLHDNTEIQNIKSTVETQTAWMTAPMRNDMATAGGVDFRDCAKRPTTVYVIIPTVELKEKAPYLRLVLSSALRALYRHGGVPTTLLIEEAFVLGYHEEIEKALSILRGHGSRVAAVFQSYSQIKKLYPETHGLFTAGAVLAFRPADLETAELLVKKAGRITVPVLGATEPRPGEPLPGRGWQQRERDRIPLAKMFGMPRGRALVWLPHEDAPRMSWVKGYFEIPELAARASPNPYHGSGTNAAARGRKIAGVAALSAAAVIAGGLWLSHAAGHNETWRPHGPATPGQIVRDDHPTPKPPAKAVRPNGIKHVSVERRK